MILNHDNELKTVVAVFESADEYLEKAVALDPHCNRVALSASRSYFPECRGLNTWDDVKARLHGIYERGNQMMEEAATEIRKAIIDPPTSIRRQRRWSETDGELDVDRALRGTPELFHESYRTQRPRTQSIAVMVNFGANCDITEETLFWRAASVVVACDLLEEAGYSCEVWGYWMTEGVYSNYGFNVKHPNLFMATRIKEAGSPMDVGTVSKTIAPWMFRTAAFSMCSIGGTPIPGLGHSNDNNRERLFSRHCNVDSSMERFFMPYSFGKSASIKAVKQVLEVTKNGGNF